MNRKQFLPLLLVLAMWEGTESAKILSISFVAFKSHRILYEPILQELARRGHEVTCVGPIHSKDSPNLRNVYTMDVDTLTNNENTHANLLKLRTMIPDLIMELVHPLIGMAGVLREACERSYELPQVKAVLQEKYDLIFFLPLMNECLWGLVHQLNASVVLFAQTSIFPTEVENLGNPNPPSFVTSVLTGHSDRMNFLQRLGNTLRTFYDWSVMNLFHYPRMEAIYRRVLNDPNLPSIKAIGKNASLVLVNSHISFSSPRPYLPDIIEIGGLHLKPAKPVPPELDEFLNGSPDGFILFSMGTALKGSLLPEHYRKMFLNVFSKLKQRVIWKWETEQMDDLPPNVKLSKWLPQQDVLGHKNIRLFITHGGHGSTTEAIYHGVPLIGIPIVGDQPSNMKKAAKFGFALPALSYPSLTEDILLEAINKALNDPSYRNKAQELKHILLDQIDHPLDRAVYWIEYVLRHQGALHLRSAARDLNNIQYFSIDVLALIFLVLFVVLVLNYLILKAILRKCFGRVQPSVDAAKKKK